MTKKGYKAEIIMKYHVNIRKALVDALVFNDTYKINPSIIIELKKPKKPAKEIFVPSFYSIDESNKMFEAFENHWLELIVKLTAFYDFRRGEILGLK